MNGFLSSDESNESNKRVLLFENDGNNEGNFLNYEKYKKVAIDEWQFITHDKCLTFQMLWCVMLYC